MIEPRLWRQAKRLWVRARRAAASQLGGSHRSVFRGAGLAFEEVRLYEPGDDVRSIDWNVTARLGLPYVKRFIEERELPWVLALDISRSMTLGTAGRAKREAAAEVAALAAAVALFRQDRVGLLLFSDRVEAWLPPRKGGKAALRLLHTALFREAVGRGTRLDAALRFIARTAPRRSLVLFLSDFQGDWAAPALRAVARRHDLIAVRLSDLRERSWPDIGLALLRDGETGAVRLVDAGATVPLAARHDEEERLRLQTALREAQGDLLDCLADGTAPERLLEHLRRRAARLRRPGG